MASSGSNADNTIGAPLPGEAQVTNKVHTPLLDDSVIRALEADLGRENCERMLHLFIEELDELSLQLGPALAANDFNQIHHIVHVLKNSAALYGAQALALAAQRLHDDRDRPAPELQREARAVELLCQQTLECYLTYRQQLGL